MSIHNPSTSRWKSRKTPMSPQYPVPTVKLRNFRKMLQLSLNKGYGHEIETVWLVRDTN